MIGKILYRLVYLLLILFLVILKAKYIFSIYCDIISGIFGTICIFHDKKRCRNVESCGKLVYTMPHVSVTYSICI